MYFSITEQEIIYHNKEINSKHRKKAHQSKEKIMHCQNKDMNHQKLGLILQNEFKTLHVTLHCSIETAFELQFSYIELCHEMGAILTRELSRVTPRTVTSKKTIFTTC